MTDIDERSKQHVLKHMNADHRSDLGLYLRHVNGLSAAELAAEGEPEMVDIDLAAIYIRTAASQRLHTVVLDPPMASWAERRTRLVALALEARTAFGVPLPEHGDSTSSSSETIPFHPPAGFDRVVFGSVVFYVAMLVLVWTGYEDGPAAVWTAVLSALGVPPPPPVTTAAGAGSVSLLSRLLGGPDGFRRIVRTIAIPVLLIHITEMAWLDRTRLAPNNVRHGSRDWWLWMGSTAGEGVCAFRRFDRLVAAAAAKRKTATGKH